MATLTVREREVVELLAQGISQVRDSPPAAHRIHHRHQTRRRLDRRPAAATTMQLAIKAAGCCGRSSRYSTANHNAVSAGTVT